MQRGMLFHWLRDPRAGVDIEQISCLNGVDAARLQARVARGRAPTPPAPHLLSVGRGGRPDAERRDSVLLDIHEEDLARQERPRAKAGFRRVHRRRPPPWIRLRQGRPSSRLTFFQTSDDTYAFVWTFPHILLDGRSFVLVLRDVIETCRALEGREPVVESRPYRDFIDWLELRILRRPWRTGATRFAASRNLCFRSSVRWCTMRPRRSRRAARPPDAERPTALRAFVERHSLTVNTMVQAAWALV